MPDENLLDRAKGDQHVDQFLNGLFSAALSAEVFGRRVYPDLSAINNFSRRANDYETRQGFEDERRGLEAGPTRALSVEVGLDGEGRLFCGSAAQSNDSSLLIYEDTVAGLTARFLSVLGGLYAAGGYLGHVNVGLAVTGLEGGVSAHLHEQLTHRHSLRPYDEDEYRRTRRFSAAVLMADPRSAASKLALPLVQAITQEAYDPFS